MCENDVKIKPLTPDFIDFDREFGDFLFRFTGSDFQEVMFAGMLVAFELRSGDPQLDLSKYAGKSVEFTAGESTVLPDLDMWKDILLQTRAAAYPEDPERTPLVFTGESSLMFRRYANYARQLRDKLYGLRGFNNELQMPELTDSGLDDIQKLAVFAGVNSRLLILSGGPGTGKTTVCGHIIRAIVEKNAQCRILFAAPTGKAQQRLAAQIRAAGADLPESSVIRKAIEEVKGATLHSFVLNPQWRSELEQCDLLLIDECSMVSLEMFSKLLEILSPSASLILAGDRRQLVSIDSGSVFADLCSCGKVNQLPEKEAGFFSSTTGISVDINENKSEFTGHIVELQKNFRSASAPGICRIAAMLREDILSDRMAAESIAGTDEKDFRFRTVKEKDFEEALKERCAELKVLPELCRAGDPESLARAMKIADSSKFICAVNRGRSGTVEVNNCILKELGITPSTPGEWKPGTILLITANDKQSGLRNGDIGIVTREKVRADGEFRRGVRFFSCPEKFFLLSELPPHECGFAISVHRSQGSGYPRITLLLPGHESAVLCRELLYTGITRAAEEIEVWGKKDELLAALSNRQERSSNLFRAVL